MILKLACIAAFAAGSLPALAQVKCTMPNGIVITQQLTSSCPAGAVKEQTLDGKPVARSAPSVTEILPAIVVQTPPPVATKLAPPTESSDKFFGEMSLFSWVIVLALIYGLYKAIAGSVGTSGKQLFCLTCGHEGPGKNVTKGSLLIEIILWMAFLIPGLIYSAWRHSSRHKTCSRCSATTLVPPDAPMALLFKTQLAK